ncbi:MAG TPA: hypothetical protein VFJ12_14295 [Segeticoccus sp.]|nr:hypothetical protein [Segeticoccus sp.]
MNEPASTISTRPTHATIRWIAVGVTFANLGIHLAMAGDHLAEMTYIGVLFIIGSALLGAVMTGLGSELDTPRTLAWTGGSLICGAEFILFVLSRTTGLPGGYHEGWTGSTESYLGLSSLFLEAVFICCAAASLTRASRTARLGWIPLHDRTTVSPT